METVDQIEAVAKAAAVETDQMAMAVEQDQKEALAVAETMEPDQAEALATAVEPDQAEVLAAAVEPDQAEAVEMAVVVETDQTTALAAATDPDQAETVVAAVEADQTKAVAAAAELVEREAGTAVVEPDPTKAVVVAGGADHTEAQGAVEEADQTETVGSQPTVTVVEASVAEAKRASIQPIQSNATAKPVATGAAVEINVTEKGSASGETEQVDTDDTVAAMEAGQISVTVELGNTEPTGVIDVTEKLATDEYEAEHSAILVSSGQTTLAMTPHQNWATMEIGVTDPLISSESAQTEAAAESAQTQAAAEESNKTEAAAEESDKTEAAAEESDKTEAAAEESDKTEAAAEESDKRGTQVAVAGPDETESTTAAGLPDQREAQAAVAVSDHSDGSEVATVPDQSDTTPTQESEGPQSFVEVQKFKLCEQTSNSDNASSLTEPSSHKDELLRLSTDEVETGDAASRYHCSSSLKRKAVFSNTETDSLKDYMKPCKLVKSVDVLASGKMEKMYSFQKLEEDVRVADIAVKESDLVEKKDSDVCSTVISLLPKAETLSSVDTECKDNCFGDTRSALETGAKETEVLSKSVADTLFRKMADTNKEVYNSPDHSDETAGKIVKEIGCSQDAFLQMNIAISHNMDLKKGTSEATEPLAHAPVTSQNLSVDDSDFATSRTTQTLSNKNLENDKADELSVLKVEFQDSATNSMLSVKDIVSENAITCEEINTSCGKDRISDLEQPLKDTKAEKEAFPCHVDSSETTVCHEKSHTEQSSSVIAVELNSVISERSMEENILKNKTAGAVLSLEKAGELVDCESQPVCAAKIETTNNVESLTFESQENFQGQITPKEDICATIQTADSKYSFSEITDGQMEIESMPGGRTPETSASKTEDKDEPSSETAAVLSVSSLPLLKEMVPMDIDKNEQQLITQKECCVAPKPALTEKSAAAMEVEAIKVEVAVKCEPNAIKAIPRAPFAVSAPQEQLPSAIGGVRNLQASVETQPGLAREFGDVAGKLEELSSLSVQESTVLPIRKTSAISDTSSESTVCSQTDHIKDGSSAELIPDPIVPLSAESVLPSEELAENADVLHNQHLSRRPETAAALKSQMTERTALNDTATVSKTIISTEDTVLDKHNATTVSTLTDNATFMDKGTLPKDTIAVSSPSDDVEMPNGKVEISSREEKGKPISDIEEPPNDSPCQIQDTLHHETVTSSDRVCLHTDESKQQSFTDRMVSELSTQSENSLSFPSEDTKNSTGTKIQMQKLEMPGGTHIDKVSDASLGSETKKFDKMSSGVDRRITEVAKLSEQTTNEAVTAMIELKGSATLQTGDTLVAETTSVSDDEAESQSQKPKLCVKNENDQVTSESITETSSLETTESMKTLGRPLNKSAVVLSLSEAETSDADTKSKVDTSIVEIVSEKLESVVSQVNQGTSVPLAMTSEGTEQELKTTGLQISQETTEIHDVAGLDTTLPSVLSTSKSENEMVKLENEQKETEIPVSEAEALQQVGQYTETEEQTNVSADEYQLETSSPKAVIEQNKLSGAEIPLGRTSLTADMQEIEAPHSPTVTSEIDIAHTLDPLSAEQNCEGKRKLPKEISSEPVVKSKVIEQTSVLECKNPVKVVESVHAEISSNQEQGNNAQETLTAPELASSSVCGSSEIVKHSLPQIDSQCPLSEVVEAAFTSVLETSARSKSVATTELVVKRGTDVMQMEKTDGIEQFLKDSNSHNVKVSCVESEKSVISVESGLEKTGEALKSSEVATSSALSSKESLVKEKRDMSELSARSSVNQGSTSISSISRPSSETNLFEKTVSKEIASDGVSISQSTVTAKDKDSLAHSTSVSVPEKNDSETAKTEVTDKILLQSCERPYISEQCYVEEKSKEENVELREISKKFKGKELSLAKEDMADSIKQIEQKSAKEDKVKDTSINIDCALLSTSLQPYANVCEGKVTENCESISGRAGSPCSQSSPSKQPKPDVKCVSSVADGSSSEKEDVEKNRTHSSTSDTSRNKNKDLQPHVKHNVKSGTDSERMEASIKRKVGEGETETEMSPKKVKVDNYNSGTPISVSDAQCLRSPESLKRKSANDDTETNDQERNTEKKKLKVETSE